MDEQRHLACVECRQQKVKCRGSNEEGAPCQRCASKGIHCIIDSDYKRTAKRQKLAQMEQEMASLKRQLAQRKQQANGVEYISVRSPSSDVVPNDTSKLVPNEKLPSGIYDSTTHISQKPEDVSGLVQNWECEPKSYDDFHLEAATVNYLFRQFVLHYHPLMPVVNVSFGPEHIYKLSQALFWTIMAVAARHAEDKDLLSKLSNIETQCLSEIAVSPVIRHSSGDMKETFNLPSVYAVQAFIIASLWPPPTASFIADSSWNTCGMAIFTAIRAGLHLPGYHKEFGRVSAAPAGLRPNQNEQTIAWIAANTVCQNVANLFGLPSVANFNHASLLSGLQIPTTVYVGYLISQVAHDIETSLNGNARDPMALASMGERLSLIRVLSARLDDLERQYRACLDDYTWFLLLLTRIRLFSYYFLDNSKLSTFQLQKSYIAVYNACLALMEFVGQAVSRNSDYMRYVPLSYTQSLWQVCAMVCRLYYSRWAANMDRRKGRDLYFKTLGHISRASILDHDVAFRAAEIQHQMWHVFGTMSNGNNEKIKNSQISIRARMAASVFFDCLWTMKEECEIQSHAPPVLLGNSQKQNQSSSSQVQVQTGSLSGQQHFNSPLSQTRSPQPPAGSSIKTESPYGRASTSSVGTPDSTNVSPELAFEWDANTAWKDINLVMEEFGFNFDSTSLNI